MHFDSIVFKKFDLSFVLLVLYTFCGPDSRACMSSGKESLKRSEIKTFSRHVKKGLGRRVSNDQPLEFAEGFAYPSLESTLGNLLLRKREEAKQVLSLVISVGAVLEKSEYRPFGDGQTNARIGLGAAWEKYGKRPVFLAVGVQKKLGDQSVVRTYQFDPSLFVSGYDEMPVQGRPGWFEVKPKGWNDSFYFNFEVATVPVNEFLKGVPESLRTFSGGRSAPDPARIGKQNAFSDLKTKNLGPGYNKDPWFALSVHGFYPDENGTKTALGGVLTWGIVDSAFGPFKHLYTCFEARNLKEEKKLGIPSGAGWHHIGDPAESLFNSLEHAPLPVAVARSHGLPRAAYGLTEVISAGWLFPDHVLVTSQNQFHWYLNPYEREVCTEIWVHKCVPGPDNHWGLKCQG